MTSDRTIHDPATREGAARRRRSDVAARRRADADRRIEEAAHEIRAPLGGLLALADLLLADDLSETARGHAEAIREAARHLLGVSTQMLGGTAAGAVALDVDRFLARVESPLAARARAQGLTFEAIRGPGVPDRLIADEGALRQIVDNLADNALRVTRAGGVVVAIDRVGEDAGSVLIRIAVRDTGPGLGDDPDALFGRYAQGPAAPGAAGIGLSLVSRLAMTMGGRTEAANRGEGGAEVAAILRLATDRAPARSAAGPMRILIAEDNAVNQRVLSTILDQFGHGYDIVEDGDAAVRAAASGAYDLVLMDAVMPGMDGLQATGRIRAMDGPAGAVRIVGATARAFEHEIAAFLAAGADAVVTKPISVTELWRAIGAPTDASRKAG